MSALGCWQQLSQGPLVRKGDYSLRWDVDLCRDRKSKAGNSLESEGTDGSIQRPEELQATLIEPYRTHNLCPSNFCLSFLMLNRFASLPISVLVVALRDMI